jgi:hypothetical protein
VERMATTTMRPISSDVVTAYGRLHPDPRSPVSKRRFGGLGLLAAVKGVGGFIVESAVCWLPDEVAESHTKREADFDGPTRPPPIPNVTRC